MDYVIMDHSLELSPTIGFEITIIKYLLLITTINNQIFFIFYFINITVATHLSSQELYYHQSAIILSPL